MLREFTDAALALLERHTALRIDPAWADAAVAGSVLILVLLSLVSAIGRLRAGLRKRPPAVPHVPAPSQPPPPHTISAPVQTLAATVAPAPRAPPARTAPSQTPRQPAPAARPAATVTQPVQENSAHAAREDRAPPKSEAAAASSTPEPAPLTPQQRKDLALALRDAVLAKVAEGGWFKDGAEPLTYRFNRVSLTRMQFEILLELPSPGGEPRSAHALHIRVDGRKKLNLEWGADGAARLRFLSPGDWTATIVSWQFDGTRRTPAAPAWREPRRKAV